MTFQPGRSEEYSTGDISARSTSETAAVYTAAKMAGEASVRFEGGSQNNLAAAAYAAATAIEISTVSKLDPLQLDV